MDNLALEDIIGNTLYITVTYDPHVVLRGKVEAIDAQANLLLDLVQELSTVDSTKSRELGLVSVPRESIVSVRMEQAALQRRMDLKQDLLSKVI